ncbi:hypothetical protein AB0M05_41455 [Streptomyces violaceusniger]|uniref:hypothetical protein n=1 Tax=Streptomyces violaceusniger TaxID=68280 RepID=UPI00342367C5
METVLASAMAILGTLLGAIVSGRAQERAAARAAEANHREEIRRDRLKAIMDLTSAVSEHRTVMWRRGDAMLKGRSAERIEVLRDESHESRKAVTGPLTALLVLIQDQEVHDAATHMITLTYAMREAFPSPSDLAEADTREAAKDTLTAARYDAVVAHDRFRDVAARYLNAT